MINLTPIELIRIQLELECVGFDADDRLVRLPCASPDNVARFLLARHEGGYLSYFRHDVDGRIVAALKTLPPEEIFENPDTVKPILYGLGAAYAKLWMGSTYMFIDEPAPDEFPDVLQDGESFVIVVDDEIVSRASSARSNAQAAEVAVETRPGYRRRGYGRQVTTAWAAWQVRQDRIAFYSHLHNNDASRALAHSMGVMHILDIVGYN
jgi:GNAT superfamily N-acetyltransferase